MNGSNGNHQPQKRQLPALLAVGPSAVKKSTELRCFRVIFRAYHEGAKSLRKAHTLSCKHATAWGADETLVEHWGPFQKAAFEVEGLLGDFYGKPVHLFIKLGEGMPWIGLTEIAPEVDRLIEDFLRWYDNPKAYGDNS